MIILSEDSLFERPLWKLLHSIWRSIPERPCSGRTPTPSGSVTTCGPGSSVPSNAELFKNRLSRADHLRTPGLATSHGSPHKHPLTSPSFLTGPQSSLKSDHL